MQSNRTGFEKNKKRKITNNPRVLQPFYVSGSFDFVVGLRIYGNTDIFCVRLADGTHIHTHVRVYIRSRRVILFPPRLPVFPIIILMSRKYIHGGGYARSTNKTARFFRTSSFVSPSFCFGSVVDRNYWTYTRHPFVIIMRSLKRPLLHHVPANILRITSSLLLTTYGITAIFVHIIG